MEFSWWTWSALVLVLLGALGLFVRSAVLTVREYGLGQGSLLRRPGAPWFWSAMALTTVVGVLMTIWVVLLDSSFQASGRPRSAGLATAPEDGGRDRSR